jgi:hypothetical protein
MKSVMDNHKCILNIRKVTYHTKWSVGLQQNNMNCSETGLVDQGVPKRFCGGTHFFITNSSGTPHNIRITPTKV